MSESPLSETLLPPEPRPSADGPSILPIVAGFGVALSIAAGSWAAIDARHALSEKQYAAYSNADLGSGLFTSLDVNDPSSLDRALSQIDIPVPEQLRLREQLLDGKLGLGLIAFWDDVAADGDAIAVTGAGVRQLIVLRKDLTPVVTPYQPGGTILVSALRDGGGSVTVAVMTRNGPVHLRRLLVGESISVPTP
jgi:hypothetical protein